jgi:hydrogenase maturation factor
VVPADAADAAVEALGAAGKDAYKVGKVVEGGAVRVASG